MYKKIFLIIIFIMLFSTMAYAQSTQSLNLKQGFNFISFTLVPGMSAVDFKNQNPAIADIYFFSVAAGSFLSLSEGTLTSLGYGKGYIIRANSATSLTISGQLPANIDQINLKAGFNLIGFSRKPEIISFSQLMAKYSVIRGIYKWNSASGSFIQVVRNNIGNIEQLDGIDPEIVDGSSYFFNILEDTSLNYGGTQIVFGITPPIPTLDTVALPIFSPLAGTYTLAQQVVISTTTPGAAIYYTTDDSTPNIGSLLYTGPILINKTTKIKAMGTKTGIYNSYVAMATYTINLPNQQQVVTPIFNVASGTYSTAQTIVITTATPGASIYFTTDGSQPTINNGILYTAPIKVGQTVAIKAIAVKLGMIDSTISLASYIINQALTSTISSVDISLPSLIAESQSIQAVVTVKDQTGSQMYSGYTTSYNIISGSSSVSSQGMVTAAVYNSSDAVANNNTLHVTITPTTGNSITKTVAFTVASNGNDVVKPTIVNVTATDSKSIVVTYSEKVSTSALIVTNYNLYHSTTGVMTTMVSGTPATNQIQASAMFTDSTHNAVIISIISVGSGLTGYPNGGMDNIQYRLYVSNVQDVAMPANAIINNSNAVFMGILQSNIFGPSISSIVVNSPTSINVIFDKALSKVSAETTGNYYIYQSSNPNNLLTITSAVMLDPTTTQKTIQISTATQVSSLAYLLSVSNVRDLSNNTISSNDPLRYTSLFTGFNTTTQDIIKPTLVSVQAIDSKNIVVTYSEAVNDTAINIMNYTLYNPTTGAMTSLVTTSTGAGYSNISATAFFADSTRKIIKISLTGIGTNLPGYPAAGLGNNDYVLYVSNVQDSSVNANTIITNSNATFRGILSTDIPAVSSVYATNGSIVATLSKIPVTEAVTSDFKIIASINGGPAIFINSTSISNNGNVSILAIPTIAATSLSQSVVYTVSYKGGIAVNAILNVPINKFLSSISINPAILTAQNGTTLTLPSFSVTATYSNATTALITGYTTSSNFNAATRVYTAPVTGTADIITITYAEGGIIKTATIAVTLTPAVTKTLSSISVNPAILTAQNGTTLTLPSFSVTATYSNATTALITGYTTSSNFNAATRVYAAPVTGTADIIAITYAEGGITKTATIAVTLTPAVTKTLSSISINPATLTAQNGTTTELLLRIPVITQNGTYTTISAPVVTATYNDATTTEVTGYTTSSNFNATTRIYTAPATGTNDTITITYAEGGITKTATVAVTLIPAVVKTLSSISINPAVLTAPNGTNLTLPSFSVTATYNNATTALITGYTASSNFNAATRVYTAPATGTNDTITITYAEGGITKTTTVAVTLVKALVSITANTTTFRVKAGASQSINPTIKATYSDSTVANVTGYTITSSNFNATNRVYTAPTTGTNDTITITYIEGGITKTAYLTVEIEFGTNDYDYTDNGTNINITKYKGVGGAVSIPDTIIGKPVTSIDDTAFYNCTTLTSISIPNSVTSIKNSAFAYCTALTSVNIPNSVTSIGGNAFLNCTNMTFISVDAGNLNYSSEYGVLYNKDKTILIQYPQSKPDSLFYIPDGVTYIVNYSFWGCKYPFRINIPNSVTNIGSLAFNHCTNLSSISVDAGNLNYSGEYGVLYNKDKTTLKFCPEGQFKTDTPNAFTVPNGVTNIDSSAFDGCFRLRSIAMPDSLTSIGSSAFSGCLALTSVTIPYGVTNIGNNAFATGNITSAYFLGNVPATLGTNIFGTVNANFKIYYKPGGSGWTTPTWNNYTTVEIPLYEYTDDGTLITITKYNGISKSVTIPRSINGKLVRSIGNSAFANCPELTSVTLESVVMNIGNSAFANCNIASAYFLGNMPTTFGTDVFANNSPSFKIYYKATYPYWTTPTWNGYPTATY